MLLMKKSPLTTSSPKEIPKKQNFPRMDFSPLWQWSFVRTEGSSACWKSHPPWDVCCTASGTRSASWNSNCSAQMETAPGDQPAFARKAFSEGRSAIQTPCTAFSIPTHRVPMHIQVQRWRMQHYAWGGHSSRVEMWRLGGDPCMARRPLSHTRQRASAERGRDRSRCTHKRTLQIRLTKRSRQRQLLRCPSPANNLL